MIPLPASILDKIFSISAFSTLMHYKPTYMYIEVTCSYSLSEREPSSTIIIQCFIQGAGEPLDISPYNLITCNIIHVAILSNVYILQRILTVFSHG